MSVHLALLISVLYLCNVYVQPKALLEEDQENQQVSVLSGSQRFLITYLKVNKSRICIVMIISVEFSQDLPNLTAKFPYPAFRCETETKG